MARAEGFFALIRLHLISSHLVVFFFSFALTGLMHCIMIYFDWESFRRVIKTLRITGLRQLQGILDLLIVDC